MRLPSSVSYRGVLAVPSPSLRKSSFVPLYEGLLQGQYIPDVMENHLTRLVSRGL